jgi:hypothetical protein
MPVTRDLSEAKRLTIVKWLEKLIATGDPTLDTAQPVAAGPPQPRAATPPPVDAEPPEGSKTRFARSLSRAKGGEQPS